MMWSTKSGSGIRFSDCLSFSKDFTWRQKITLTGAADNNPLIILSYQNSLEGRVTCNATEGKSCSLKMYWKNAVRYSDAL